MKRLRERGETVGMRVSSVATHTYPVAAIVRLMNEGLTNVPVPNRPACTAMHAILKIVSSPKPLKHSCYFELRGNNAPS